MIRVTVDDLLRSKLHNFTEPLELCETSGKVLGHVFPVNDLSDYEPFIPQFSDEELKRQLQSDEKSYTTEEVLAFFHSSP